MDRARNSAAHGGHRARLRERVRLEGLESLEPHEQIEFLLFYAIPRQDVNELAHRLVSRFGDVSGVLKAAPKDLVTVPGMGPQAARWLSLVGEAVAACAPLSPLDRPLLSNCLDAFRYAARAERALTPPCALQLCLDAKGRLLFRRELCPSLSWGEPDTLREALRDVLVCQAHAAILLLLTGAQTPEPGEYDLARAAAYMDTLRVADCELLDVILAGGDALFSMKREGKLPEPGFASAEMRMLHESYQLHMPPGALRIRDFQDSGEPAGEPTNDSMHTEESL